MMALRPEFPASIYLCSLLILFVQDWGIVFLYMLFLYIYEMYKYFDTLYLLVSLYGDTFGTDWLMDHRCGVSHWYLKMSVYIVSEGLMKSG